MAGTTRMVAGGAVEYASSAGSGPSASPTYLVRISPDHDAVVAKPLNMVQRLMNRHERADVEDEFGRNALHYACEAGVLRHVLVLVDDFADLDMADADGRTALMIAAQHGHLDIVRELRARGANTTIKSSDGRTALHYAAMNRTACAVVEHLLRYSLTPAEDVCRRDDAGLSPLHYAARAGNRDSVVALLARGAACDTQAGRKAVALCHEWMKRKSGASLVLDPAPATNEDREPAGQAPESEPKTGEVSTGRGTPNRQVKESEATAESSVERENVSEKALLALVPPITATLKKLVERKPSSVDERVVAEALLAEWRSSNDGATDPEPSSSLHDADESPSSRSKQRKKKKKKVKKTKPVTEHEAVTDVVVQDKSDGALASVDGVEQEDFSAIVVASGDATVVFLGEDDSYPFHVAVQKSHGDLDAFCEMMEVLANDGDDPLIAMPMALRFIGSARESLCAAEYAYARGFPEIGDYLVSRMAAEEEERGSRVGVVVETMPAISVQLLEDVGLVAYAYIFNVDFSKGKTDMCKTMCRIMEPGYHSVFDRIQANVVRERSRTVSWSALEYASYHGYEEILHFLLEGVCRNAPMITKTQMRRICQQQRVSRQ